MSDETLELHDIQGLVLRGYGELREARFLVLEVADAEAAREYLRGLCDRINLARDSPKTGALQVAFTAAGLERLGVPDSALLTFSREFREGMDDGVRSTALGDRDDNDPSTWSWGRTPEPVHVLLLIYADKATIESQLSDEQRRLAGGFRILHEKQSTSRKDQKEHFGWSDGLSMPKIAGVPPERPRKKKQESWTGAIPAGEFVLGYRNDYGAFTECPTVDRSHDPANHLPPIGTRKSLGRNGTYLVYREMTQDVFAFWNYLATHSREGDGDPAERAIALGAKMVGRWPDGAPLIDAAKDPRKHSAANKFQYGADLAGLRCPHGAHIRRANPRDVLAVEDRGSKASLLMVRKHQMIRRGRPFGRFVDDEMDLRKVVAMRDAPDTEHRGLHFLCLVGDIGRQFEFVQRAWIDSANFDSLFKDGDPIAAVRRRDANANDEFTCPADPVRRKYKQMPRFTRLVGGGYFFLPGLAALRFIARHP